MAKKHKHIDKVSEKKNTVSDSKSDEEINLSADKFISGFKKYTFIIIPAILLIIALFFAIYFRMLPNDVPATDVWAKNTVENLNKQIISNSISKQYANLPKAKMDQMVEQNWQQLLKDKKVYWYSEAGQITLIDYDMAVSAYSNYYKEYFKDNTGHVYLNDIDTYLWYGYMINYEKTGTFGNELVDGEPRYTLRDGRLGQPASFTLHSFLGVMVYKVGHFFNSGWQLVDGTYYLSVILMALAIIPAFFIGRKLAGNIGGFVAALFIAIQPSLLARTVSGVSDTDPYIIIFPLFMVWAFLEARDAKHDWAVYSWTAFMAIIISMFVFAWGFWWFAFDMIIGVLVFSMLMYFIFNRRDSFKKFKNTILERNVKILGSFLVFTSIFIVFYYYLTNRVFDLFLGVKSIFYGLFQGPIAAVFIKNVGVNSLWPNVLTTVAELNLPSFNEVISSIGGKIFFTVAILGVLFLIIRAFTSKEHNYDNAFLLTGWFLGLLAASLIAGVRFIAILIVPFAIAFGVFFGIVFEYLANYLHKEFDVHEIFVKGFALIAIVLVMYVPMMQAYQIGKNEVPIYNDAWDNTLAKIREDSNDSIISSWWDFGHWFTTMGQRRVTFDGGDQGNRIYWIGKTLVTKDEDESIGVLKMLNCEQENAYNKMFNYTNDTLKSIDLLHKAILVDKSTARKIYLSGGLTQLQADSVLTATHCDDLLPNYYITSEDMVGKSGVWGHFGSWNFTRAAMYNEVQDMGSSEGVAILKDKFALNEKDAQMYYNQIVTTPGDQWITSWPSYASGLSQCNRQGDVLTCANGFIYNETSQEGRVSTRNGLAVPSSVVFAANGTLVEVSYETPDVELSVDLVEQNGVTYAIYMAPELSTSIFTRLFYYDGTGLNHFKKLYDTKDISGQRIITWKVDFDSMYK